MANIDNSFEEFCCRRKQENGVVDKGGDGVEDGVITVHNKYIYTWKPCILYIEFEFILIDNEI